MVPIDSLLKIGPIVWKVGTKIKELVTKRRQREQANQDSTAIDAIVSALEQFRMRGSVPVYKVQHGTETDRVCRIAVKMRRLVPTFGGYMLPPMYRESSSGSDWWGIGIEA